MLFHFYDSNTGCPYRYAGRVLARSSGLRGTSISTLVNRTDFLAKARLLDPKVRP